MAMDASPITEKLSCTQCNGELHAEAGQVFLTCPYCGAAVYLDKSRVVFHWYLAPTLQAEQAQASLARWMAGNQTVKDLDKKATLAGSSFEFFPLWLFRRQRPDGRDQLILQPAAATSVSELLKLNLPAGDLRKYDFSLDAQSRQPTVPLEVAQGWLTGQQIPPSEIVEQSLVHLPIYTFKYVFQNKPYTAIVEAGTGGVFANIYPAKAEAPYYLAGGLTALVYLFLALFPIIGGLVDGAGGASVGLALCTGVGLLAAPFLWALAYWIASKI